MSTAVPQDFVEKTPKSRSVDHPVQQAFAVAGSLKITCVLFVLGMFIVLVGSLAQSRRDVWQVVNQYFRVYIAKVEVRDFFPPSMFPQLMDYDWNEQLGMFASFPFPGGWLIGWLLLGNLLAAHGARIHIQSRGIRMLLGLLTVAIGLMLMALIVVTGNQQTGVEQGNTLLSFRQIWNLLLLVMVIAIIGFTTTAYVSGTKSRAEKFVLLGIAGMISALLVYFAISGPVNPSSMRILWQLMKACVCSAVLLIGCQLLFKKRCGIVVIHLGVMILMISELVVGLYGHESLMFIQEGDSVNYAKDIREIELSIVTSDGDQDSVVVVPEAMLLQSESAVQAGQTKAAVISLAAHSIPFDLRVTDFYRNCQLRSSEPDDTLTSTGMGAFAVPVELDPVDGMNEKTDASAAYIEIIDRQSGEPIETILASFNASESRALVLPERITLDDESWDLSLRFHRNYRPYDVKLLDVRRDTYVGSATPRNFQSRILITDSETGKAEEFTLWMNNPLRYKGETFYQSGYHPLPSGNEATTLQLVRNSGWMLPYIGCVVVAFGMFAQFWQTLRRFLVRTSAKRSTDPAVTSRTRQTGVVWVPVAVAVLCVFWLGSKTRAPRPVETAMNLYEFAQLPVAGGGRTQPVDSWARSQLMLTSHKSTFKGELTAPELDAKREELLEIIQARWPDVNFESLQSFNGEYEDWIAKLVSLTSSGEKAVEVRVRDRMITKMSAVRWFLDMIARPDRAVRHRVIRIDNDQLLSLLGLEQRAGLVYSLAEIQENLSNLEQTDRDARQLLEANQDNRLTALQRRVMALFNTIQRLNTMQQVFQPAADNDLLPLLVETWRILNRLKDAPVPMGIATGVDDDQAAWETVRAGSLVKNCRDRLSGRNIDDRTDLEAWFQKELPRETLLQSLQTNYRLLQEEATKRAGEDPVAENAANLLAAQLIPVAEDRFNREVFSLVAAAAPGQPMKKVVDDLDEDRVRRIAGLTITRDLFDIFQTLENDPADKRLEDVRRRVRSLQQANPEDSDLGKALNDELFAILLNDMSERAGTMIYPSTDGENVFTASANGMMGALRAWAAGDVTTFNESVSRYQNYLSKHEIARVDVPVVRLETFFNRFDPFGKAIYLYLPAMLLSFLGWILWPQLLRNTAFAMIIVAFVVHTVALLLRIEISGRPPVTSLYSSAIFIGWAIVGASLVIERLVGYGIGNIVAASIGSATLMIAHYLAVDEGDTFSVMQAVLDTTFWLATHVVCITLGYGATFLAGMLGLCYVVLHLRNSWWRSPRNTAQRGATDLAFLGKVVYGILCFALFFSLVGTVLGGLWADDSWGRFWGWDPKENGALIIVMWNALVLHARWDKMVRDYGTSVLAMGGNMVTAWSWFGVNELRAGLHSYGFTEGRMGMLMGFIGVQLIIIIAAAIIRPNKTASA
ncbi:MAG: cytochrome c biogenesis protein CcsA [Fuerstiella sp.]|nr:cytochrome c biogenesis protein CcsA [Fuerstiella sp.]